MARLRGNNIATWLATATALAIIGYATLALGGIGTESVIVETDIFANNIANQGAAPTMVWTSATNGYAFFLTAAGAIAMASTTDSGATWTATPRTVDSVNTTDAVAVAVWYDRWTEGDTGNIIHIATTDTGIDDIYYTQLDVSTGALTTTVVTTTQAATCVRTTNSCLPAITKARNGHLFVATTDGIDSWVDRCTGTCTSTANWSERTGAHGGGGDDWNILIPVPNTDNVMLVFYDTSATALKYNIFSATSSTWWNVRTVDSSIANNVEGPKISATYSTSSDLIWISALDYNTGASDVEIRAWKYDQSTWAISSITAPTTTSKGNAKNLFLAYDPRNDDLYQMYEWSSTTNVADQQLLLTVSTDAGTTWTASSTDMGEIDDPMSNLNGDPFSPSHLGVLYKYNSGIYSGELFYNKIAQYLDPAAPPAGGGAIKRHSEIWFD